MKYFFIVMSQNRGFIRLHNSMKAEEFNQMTVPLRTPLLQQALRLTGGDGDTAEDLVQETMLRLWELRDELHRHPNVEALARTVLRNKWTDYWRHSRHTVNDEALLARQRSGTTTSPPDDLELIELIVNSLPPLQQRIFRMKEMEGYEKEEIMLVTGCTDESLRQNLSRARRRIRELFIKLSTS